MINLDFGFYWSLLLKRLWLIIPTLLLVTAAGVAVAYLLPPIYRATAKLLVESAQIPADLARSTVPTSPAEQLQIIQEDVFSRENLVALAKELSLYSNAQLMAPDAVADDMRARTLIEPVPLDVAGGETGAGTIFQVSFDARTPLLAAAVTNRLVTMILDKDTELRTARASDTVQFFSQEATRLDTALKELDAQILDFKDRNIQALPDSLDFRRSQQSALQERLLLIEQEDASLARRLADLKFRPLAARGEPVTPEQKALEEARSVLTTQLETFSEDSPTIAAIRARIAALEKQIVASANSDTTSTDASAATIGPEMADLTYRRSTLRKEAEVIKGTIEELNASILATPANTTVLNTLERRNQNLQAQYDAAVKRQAEASTGQQIELRLKGQRLSLIESATPPLTQLSPKRTQIVLGALAAALALAGAELVLPELLNRRIRRPIELVNKLDIRPMVTIPYIAPPPLTRWLLQRRKGRRPMQARLRRFFEGSPPSRTPHSDTATLQASDRT